MIEELGKSLLKCYAQTENRLITSSMQFSFEGGGLKCALDLGRSFLTWGLRPMMGLILMCRSNLKTI